MTSPSTQVGAILGWYSLKGGSGTVLQGTDDPACVEEIGDCTAKTVPWRTCLASLHAGSSSLATRCACADESHAATGTLITPTTRACLQPAGYQGAYGITVEVESHPFDCGTMLFMDWRDDHLDASPDVKARNEK